MSEPSRYLSLKQVCARMGRDPRTIHRWRKRGIVNPKTNKRQKLDSIKIGEEVWVHRVKLLEFLHMKNPTTPISELRELAYGTQTAR